MTPSWTGTCQSRWATPVSITALLAAVLMVVAGDRWAALGPAFAALLIAPFRHVTVTIDRDTLRVDFAGPYWRPVVLRRSDIRRSSAIDAGALRYGGWGYRGSLKIFHRLAVILRRGSAIRLELADGGWFIVTVDEAEAGVDVLQTRASS